MSEEKGVPFFANKYLQTEEGQIELNMIIKDRESIDFLCFQLLSEVKSSGWLEELIATTAHTGDVEMTDQIADLMERVDDAIDERDRLSNEMIKLISGQ